MTKIKNTKKGMAKKTLSMSLVVAMLATSNVPVWAAEFSDGSDVAVETEAPVAGAATEFSDDTVETPAVENDETTAAVATEGASGNLYAGAITFTNVTDNAIEWGKEILADVSVKMPRREMLREAYITLGKSMVLHHLMIASIVGMEKNHFFRYFRGYRCWKNNYINAGSKG
ncbi:MAG: hypothetical protein ACLVHS_12925 [Blautia wexlerae]